MPTYEYRCKDCGEDLEAVQSFDDDPLTECPSCGGRLKKVFGSIGISFKGSGFYKTDARGSSSSSSRSSDDSKDSKGDSSSKTSKGDSSSKTSESTSSKTSESKSSTSEKASAAS